MCPIAQAPQSIRKEHWCGAPDALCMPAALPLMWAMLQGGSVTNVRVKEHCWAVDSGDCVNSALVEHAWGSHHPVNWNCVKVLDNDLACTRDYNLGINIYTRSQSTPLNRDTGATSHAGL